MNIMVFLTFWKALKRFRCSSGILRKEN